MFFLIAALYCRPALKGKVLVQTDVVYWKAMAQSSFKYKAAHGHFPLWTNSMYCGMPGYLIAMDAYNPLSIVYLHLVYMTILPKPICFFFLLCATFYFLSQVLKIDPYLGILGGIAYGYASYSSIILVVGHETKMMAMAYGPALLGAILLVYQRKYWLGLALSIIFASLLLAVNHLQITYYYLLVAFMMTVFYSVYWFRNNDYRHFYKSMGLLFLAACLAVGSNMVTIATTFDNSKATRQGDLNMKGQTSYVQSSGYSVDYAFAWSYEFRELFTLLIPNIYGGSSTSDLPASSHFVQTALGQKTIQKNEVGEFVQDWPMYWGNQPSTSGPVYAGVVICFLFVLGMLHLKHFDKWWIITCCLLGICTALGKNFGLFNNFIFQWLPFYNKFRAPSMTLVIPQLLMPLLGMMALQNFLIDEGDQEKKWTRLRLTGIIMAGFLLIATLYYFSFNYKGHLDWKEAIPYIEDVEKNPQNAVHLYQAMLQDRKSMFAHDLIRSTLITGVCFFLLWSYLRFRARVLYVIAGLAVLASVDLLAVGRRYLKGDQYQEAKNYDQLNFAPTSANLQIMKDSSFFRVADEATYTDPRTYYYHNDMSGYSPVVLTLIKDLLTVQDENPQLMNMLNVKYVIKFNPNHELIVDQNRGALGNCWFVKGIHFVNGAVNEMNAMNHFKAQDTAVVDESFRPSMPFLPEKDSLASIRLIGNYNDSIVYESSSAAGQFAVFSEVYYERGWKAYIDHRESPIIRTDYALRGLVIPRGHHKIKFEFRPAAYYNSLWVAVIASLIAWLIILFAFWKEWRSTGLRILGGHSEDVESAK